MLSLLCRSFQKSHESFDFIRVRSLAGSHSECQRQLTSFGIPNTVLPVNKDGVISLENHMGWLKKREEIENSRLSRNLSFASGTESSSAEYIQSGESVEGLHPAPEDILFGRGKAVMRHPGNARFKQIVDSLSRKYDESGRLEKICITRIVVQMVKESMGRFLKRKGDGGWEEVDGTTARRKVAHAFRNSRRMQAY